MIIETVNIFLGAFITGAPFLLLGAIASGLIAEFATPDDIQRLVPDKRSGAIVAGMLVGFALPVTEYGVVPLARRLEQHGLPPAGTVALLVGGATINPVTIAATWSVFGWGSVTVARILAGGVLAVGLGLLYSVGTVPSAVFMNEQAPPRQSDGTRAQRVLCVASDEFVRFGPLLVLGSLVSALVQMLAPLSDWLALTAHPAGQVALAVSGAVFAGQHVLSETLQLTAAGRGVPVRALVGFLAMGTAADINTLAILAPVIKRRHLAYVFVLLLQGSILVGLLLSLTGIGSF